MLITNIYEYLGRSNSPLTKLKASEKVAQKIRFFNFEAF